MWRQLCSVLVAILAVLVSIFSVGLYTQLGAVPTPLRIVRELATLAEPPEAPAACAAENEVVAGSTAPELLDASGNVIDLGPPTLLFFLRHCGCPVAEKAVRDAAPLSNTVQVVLIGMCDTRSMEAWLSEFMQPDDRMMTIVPDASLCQYTRWGVRTHAVDVDHLTHPAVEEGLKLMQKEGIKNRMPSGSRWQKASAFAVAENTVKWTHVPKHALDLPSTSSALQALVGSP